MADTGSTAPDREPAGQRRIRAFAAALCGVLAMVAALAAGHLVAAFVNPNASPYLAVGNGAIDLTPAWLKDWAVRTFGENDKAVLLAGMAVVLLAVAALVGFVDSVSKRSPWPGVVLISAIGLVGVAAVAARPDLTGSALVAPLASLLTGIVVFPLLCRAAGRSRAARAEGRPGSSRRVFLRTGAGVALGAGVAGLAGRLLSGTRDATASRAAVGAVRPAIRAAPIPADADFAKLGTPPFLTPAKDFYRVDTALAVPRVTTEEWSLRIHGLVDRERRYGFADIRNRPLVERTITMTCVSNEVGGSYVSTANFVGVELADLLREAGVRNEAQQLFSTSVDGWTSGTPIEAAADPARGALLAIGMNGEPLPLEHGFPARMVIPGLYGYVSATKWVTDLEVTTWRARQAYWLNRDWAERAPIKTQSRIDTPRGFDTVPEGTIRVAGVAWAQGRGIAKVEVRLDDQPWREAILSAEVNVDTWRMWWIEFSIPTGGHRVTCRATDREGQTQTEDRVGTVPDGATGWHTINFTAG